MTAPQRPFPRRTFLKGAAALAMLSSAAASSRAAEASAGAAMSRDIVMVHGASEGGWVFDEFRKPFEARGWTVHAPDLVGHGNDKADAKTRLKEIGLADYLAQLAGERPAGRGEPLREDERAVAGS